MLLVVAEHERFTHARDRDTFSALLDGVILRSDGRPFDTLVFALAVVRPAWKPGLHSSRTLSRLQSRRMRSTTIPANTLRSTSINARGR